jgi:hypothetical protein
MARIDHDVVTETGPYPLLANVQWRTYAAGGYVAPVVVTPIPPAISNVLPTPGTPVAVTDPISFDVTDLDGFRSILVGAKFGGVLIEELVYNGTSFTAPYATGSTCTAIANGFHFSLARFDGWPGSPTITPYAFDTTGQES